jgi:hypothetical protein
LWRENHRSVNARYGERTRTPQYTYRRPGGDIGCYGWAAIDMLVHCYDYQTCEHATYEQSRAFGWIQQLKDSLHAKAPCYQDRQDIFNVNDTRRISFWGVPTGFDFPERDAA